MLGVISYHPLVHIELGPLSISPHGIGIAAGFLAGARLLLPRTRSLGVHDDDVYSMLTRAAVGAIVGARLAYVVNHASDFSSLVEVFKVWEGGISLMGGFFGAIIFTMPAMRRRRLSFWKLMDACAPGMALGVVVGRIGDLVVADHLGKTTDFVLGYRCPPVTVDTASPCIAGTVVHQTALYDLVLTVPLLCALLWLRRQPRFDGFLIMAFAAWYGSQRVLEDFLREDVRHFGLTGSQMTALVTVAVSLSWLAFVRRTPRRGRWDEQASVGAVEDPTPVVAADDVDSDAGHNPDDEAFSTVAAGVDAGFGDDRRPAATTDPPDDGRRPQPAEVAGPDPHERED